MIQRILNFASFLVIFSMIFALPLAALAQDAGMMQNNQMMGPNTGFSSGNTCNVNGMEMPGSCEQYNQQMGAGQGGQGMMGPGGGQGMNGQQMGPGGQGMGMGPSEEQMQKMEEQRQAQEKKMRARGMKQMKSGMKGLQTGIKSIEKMMTKLEKQNIPLPADLKDTISQVKVALEKVMAAEDPEEVTDEMEIIQEKGQILQEMGPRLGQLAQLPSMIKKAKTEISRVEKAYQKAAKKAIRAKVEVTSILEKWQAEINVLKESLAKVEAGGFAEDEDPMQVIGEEIFGNMQEIWRFDQIISMVLNVKQELKRVNANLTKYAKTITRLEKKGEDMTEAKAMLDELKAKYEEAKNLAWDKLEADEVEEYLSDLDSYMEMQQQLEEMLNLQTPTIFDQQMKAPQNNMPQLNMPNFKKMMYDAQGLKNEISQQWTEEQKTLLAEFQTEKTKKLNTLAVLLKAVKSKVDELVKDGVALPAELQQGVANTLAALGSSSAVAQK